jgi:predicted esterase
MTTMLDAPAHARLATLASVGVLALVAACSDASGDGLARPSSSSGGSSGDPADPDGGSSGGSSSGGSSSGATSSSSGSTSSGGGPGSLAAGKTTRTINAGGKSRTYVLVAPPAVSAGKLPLVVALHGNGDQAQNFLTATGLEAQAAALGYIVAAPQGESQQITIGQQTINVDWDAYRTPAQGNIDTPLLDAIVAELTQTGSVDTQKVSVYGYSQGGYLSFRWGMEASAKLSCAAVGAAASPGGSQLSAAAARKIPVSLQIGTGDSALSNARSTKADLEAKGFPLDYREIQAAGHVPYPGDPKLPLQYCLGKSL